MWPKSNIVIIIIVITVITIILIILIIMIIMIIIHYDREAKDMLKCERCTVFLLDLKIYEEVSDYYHNDNWAYDDDRDDDDDDDNDDDDDDNDYNNDDDDDDYKNDDDYDLQRAMAAEAEASREARAKVLRFRIKKIAKGVIACDVSPMVQPQKKYVIIWEFSQTSNTPPPFLGISTISYRIFLVELNFFGWF